MSSKFFSAAVLAGTALLGVGLLSGCGSRPGADAPADSTEVTKLVFAAIPSEGSDELKASFAPLIEAIERETGVPVEFQAASSNSGVIEAQVAERVDIAVYGAFSYYLASAVADVEPIAIPVQVPDGAPGVHSYGLVRAGDTAINSLPDARGKDVCFTDPASSSGYLAPAAGLIEAGIDPADDITAVYAGGHDSSVAALLAGDCELAFAADSFVDEVLPAKGVLDPTDVTKVWTSPSVPGPPFVVGRWLPEDVRAKITDAVTSYTSVSAVQEGFCDGTEIPAPAAWGENAGQPSCKWGANAGWAYVPSTDADFDPIDRICETTKSEVCAAGS